ETLARSGLSVLLGGVKAPGRGFEPRLTDPELIAQPYSACLEQSAIGSRFAFVISMKALRSQLSQLAYHVRQVHREVCCSIGSVELCPQSFTASFRLEDPTCPTTAVSSYVLPSMIPLSAVADDTRLERAFGIAHHPRVAWPQCA